VSWQPWLYLYAGMQEQVRITSSSWRLEWMFRYSIVSMYLDLKTCRLLNTFRRCLVDIPGDNQVPMVTRTLQSTLPFSLCNGLDYPYAHDMFCPVLIADFQSMWFVVV